MNRTNADELAGPGMTPGRWQEVKNILEQALELDSGDRAAFVRSECGDDTILSGEVSSLLDLYNTGDDPLDTTALAAALPINPEGIETFVGRQIGQYRLKRELGAGGMGTVYLAERTEGEFDQTVAVKLIKRSVNTDAVRRRFYRERQILASLEHPNIARLIDGGTNDGQPYLVMEYVEGVPITDYAGANDLSVDARLDLFREVCGAVAYAHRNLVVHRDIKPSNILVGADGKPKLLDFGIAKLTRTGLVTDDETQHFVFTPEYASPEQLHGEPLTTATDTYSLGVILFELLTGSRPYSFEGKNLGEILRSVSKTRPARPSSAPGPASGVRPIPSVHRKALKGDLDNIILKALQKEPERRYSSVDQFSEDIRRHLKGLPVLARRDTLTYRVSKFARRNPLVVAAAALVFFTLTAGIVATGYQARQANIEREKAERRFNDVRTLANSFMFEINEKIAQSPIQARELVVTRALEYLDKLAAEAEGDEELQSDLAEAYEKIGNVQSELFSPMLGKATEALTSHRKALEMREKLFAAEPHNIDRGIAVGRSHSSVGDILLTTGHVGGAAEAYSRAIGVSESLLSIDARHPGVRRGIARYYSRLGQATLRSGALSGALANYNRSLELYQQLAGEQPDDRDLERSVGILFSYIGYVKIKMGEHNEAIRNFGDSLATSKKLSTADPDNRNLRGQVGTAYLWLGVALSEQGSHITGMDHLRQALEIQDALYRSDNENFGEVNALADTHLEIGRAAGRAARETGRVSAGKAEAAIRSYDTAIAHYQVIRQKDPNNLSVRRQIAFTRRNRADAVFLTGETDRALEEFRETMAEFEELTQADTNNTEWKYDLAYCHLRIGEILSVQGANKEARPHYAQAITLLEKLAAESPEDIEIKISLQQARAAS